MLKEISSEQLNKVLAINSGSWTKIRKQQRLIIAIKVKGEGYVLLF